MNYPDYVQHLLPFRIGNIYKSDLDSYIYTIVRIEPNYIYFNCTSGSLNDEHDFFWKINDPEGWNILKIHKIVNLPRQVRKTRLKFLT